MKRASPRNSRSPSRIIDYLALMGDKVDNVPGINKCGPKTAAKWISEYGSLDGVREHASEVKGRSANTCVRDFRSLIKRAISSQSVPRLKFRK